MTAQRVSRHRNRPFAFRLGCALRGIGFALRTQASVRWQALAAAAVALALCVLRPAPLWWALAALACAAVLAAELLNTAIERLADELHPGDSDGIRDLKDCAAGAVLLAALAALGVAAALAVHLLHATRG